MKILFVLAVAGVFLNGGAPVDLGWEKVKVEGGYISGGVNSSGDVHFFKGIPFAAPPVGALRWKAPQALAPWDGIRSCVQPGASPMQNKPEPFLMWTEDYLIPPTPIGEDCLYLNVWTGARVAKERRPVLVFIYGGGFGSGGGNVPIYDGEAMARKGVVFLTINYRVGIFGFFSHPGLTKESGHGASGNYGLMDQIAALQWIKNNIAAFGGDPGNVTIAGQSAGSMSVNCLVASPLAKGLFIKAIGESGALFSRESQTLAQAEAGGEKLAGTMGAATLDALRALPADELLKKGEWNWAPIVDGYVLPEQIADIFVGKRSNPVALLTGWNEDEGFAFGPKKGTDADSVAEMKKSRDMIFGRQNYAWAVIASGLGERVFVYRFVRQPPTALGGRKWGAFHTAEVPYAYDNLKFVKRPFEPVDYNLADAMSGYLVNFAKNGDPNGVGLERWENYTREGGKIMVFGQQPAMGGLPDKDALETLYGQMNLR
jgi:para-nitrobenzyl esterase